MPLFPDSWLSELLSKNDIVSVVSEYVTLSPKGGRMWGCCPFHNEKTPSFSVQQDKQLYYCFGCHAGGSVIQFVMETERLSYSEAVKHLAQRVGMELPNEINDDKLRAERAYKERLYAVLRESAYFYYKQLMSASGKRGQEYFAKRGITGKIAKLFGLGYAVETWDGLLNHLDSKGFSEREMVDAGVVVKSDKGRVYDAYRNRVTFPIIATNGRVIGFGARTLGDDKPKYINTGDTLVYNKRQNLYALNLMRGKKFDSFIMVEGYMDAISLFSAGVENVVASLGTALTTQQARLIKRYVDKVYISYDGDAAGQNAMIRGLDILAAEGLDVKVIKIPDGLDPDDYVRKYGKDEYLTLRESALTLNAFKLQHMAEQYDFNTEDGREAFAKSACAFVGGLQPVERERYVSYIARWTGLSSETVAAQCASVKPHVENTIGKNRNNRSEKREKSALEMEKSELLLIACMLESRAAAMNVMEKLSVNNLSFSDDGLSAFADLLLAKYMENDKIDFTALVACADAKTAEQVTAASAMYADSGADINACINDCIKNMSLTKYEARLREIGELLDGGRSDASIIAEFADLQKKIKSFK